MVFYILCFLNEKNQIYIVSSNYSDFETSESLKIFDLEGKILKKINNKRDLTYFVESYYDNKLSKNYIITCNFDYAKSYDFDKNKLYHIYNDKMKVHHYTMVIIDNEEIIKLLDTSHLFIRIWNFHTGDLLDSIIISNNEGSMFNSMCLLDNNHIVVVCQTKIKIVNINNKTIIKRLKGHNDNVLCVKKIVHPQYGECIISKGIYDEPIKLWVQ